MQSPVKKEKKKKSKDKTEVDADGKMIKEFKVEPSEAPVPKMHTSAWPLLLKNFDRLNVRTNHYTPLPHGEL